MISDLFLNKCSHFDFIFFYDIESMNRLKVIFTMFVWRKATTCTEPIVLLSTEPIVLLSTEPIVLLSTEPIVLLSII